MDGKPRCQYKTDSGGRCSNRVYKSYQGCYLHAVEAEPLRRANAKRGGEAGGRGRSPKEREPVPGGADLQKLKRIFEGLAGRVINGTLNRSDAAVAGQLLNGARACIATHAQLKETFEFAERLRRLEEESDPTSNVTSISRAKRP